MRSEGAWTTPYAGERKSRFESTTPRVIPGDGEMTGDDDDRRIKG